MVTTPSTLLRTARQGRNDNVGTWDTVAHGIFDRLEEAIMATAAIVTTGGTYTLTKNDLVADEGRSPIVRITGALTSNATIILPYNAKAYLVFNDTSGAFSVTIQSTLPQILIIPQGYFQLFYTGNNGGLFATTPAFSKTLGIDPLAYGSAKIPRSALAADVQADLTAGVSAGALSYQSGWNASTNSPALTSSVGTKGFYYLVTTAGSTSLNDINQWDVGDKAVYNGTSWERWEGAVSSTEIISSLGYTPVQQGTGVGQFSNAIKIGWSGERLKVTVDVVNMGNVVFDNHLASYWNSSNFDPATKQAVLGYTPVNKSGDTLWGPLYFSTAAGGFNGFEIGTGDGVTYATHNYRLRGWHGIGFSDHTNTVHGVYNFRTGTWDVHGGYRINGQSVYHPGNPQPNQILAHARVNGSTGALLRSANVISCTRVAAGAYDIVIAGTLPTNFEVFATASRSANNAQIAFEDASLRSGNTIRIFVVNNQHAAADDFFSFFIL